MMRTSSRMVVYDFMCENVTNEKITNPYVIRFTKEPMIKTFRKTKFNEWKSILNKNSLKKEITECYGAVNLVIETVNNMKLDEYKTIVFFDMCSGKGYNSVVLLANLPESVREKTKIVMLDKDTTMNLSHLNTLDQQIQFQRLCIFPEKKDGNRKLVEDMMKIMKQYGEPGKDVAGIMMGVHLCVHLSEIFINAYNSVDSLLAMVLAPCCTYENEHNQEIYTLMNTSIYEESGMKHELFHFFLWNYYLFNKVNSATSVKRMMRDELVMSERNNFIIALKKSVSTHTSTTDKL